MITKRYLIDSDVARPYIEQDEAINAEFADAIAALRPGGNLGFYADAHHDIVRTFSERISANKASIVLKNKLAPAMSSRDVGRISFDNFLGWDIEISIFGKRMFMEVRCVNLAKFPITDPPPWLVEIDAEEMKLLSGVSG